MRREYTVRLVIEVDAESAQEAADLGVRLLDELRTIAVEVSPFPWNGTDGVEHEVTR